MSENKTAKANETTLPLWRVNYTYTAGVELRGASLIVPAATSAEAEAYAGKYLATRGKENARVNAAKPY